MDLVPNYSLLVQIVTFLVLWAALKKLMFEPVLNVLDERERRTSGAMHDAETAQHQVHAARARYDQAMREARQALSQETQAARNAALAESNRAVEEVRAQEAAAVAAMRESLAKQVADARRSLAAEAQAIAGEMIDRVTGRAS